MSRETAVDFAASALITIDVQRDTLDGRPLEAPGTTAALPAIRTLVESFRRSGRPIVHMVRLYRPDGSNVDLCRRADVAGGAPWLLAGSDGSQIAPELLHAPHVRLDSKQLLGEGVQPIASRELVMYKPRWGAFYETSLETYLKREEVRTTVFCGANFPNCPRTSIYEASERDFNVVVARDAISGIYRRGEVELENIGAVLLDAAEISES